MKRQYVAAVFGTVAMSVLLLDTKTALYGVSQGVQLCIQTVIPSLFLFIFISIVLTSAMSGRTFAILRPICRPLGIPEGAESLLIMGLIGGYPVGAQCVAEAARSGAISTGCGRRLLSFCSNAGPSFIFGIGSILFSKVWMCWALWGIQIASALTVGILMPGADESAKTFKPGNRYSLSQALQKAITVMAMICGWVVIFRVIIAFVNLWFLWFLPDWAVCLFCGTLELANGCCSLAKIANEQLRFILCAVFLSFGGICVSMQTYSVTEGVDSSLYLPGKLLQTVISTLLASSIISREIRSVCICLLIFVLMSMYFVRKNLQKRIAFSSKPMYNSIKAKRR